jgi:hypothetical protein
MCIPFTRVSLLFIVYQVCYSHAPAGRGPVCNRPRPERPQLNPSSTAENECCCGSAHRQCTGKANRQQDAMKGSSGMVKNVGYQRPDSTNEALGCPTEIARKPATCSNRSAPGARRCACPTQPAMAGHRLPAAAPISRATLARCLFPL